jgi:hypothetical protein
VRRRDFIRAIAGSAVAWPLASHAQQSVMPVIGFLRSRYAPWPNFAVVNIVPDLIISRHRYRGTRHVGRRAISEKRVCCSDAR